MPGIELELTVGAAACEVLWPWLTKSKAAQLGRALGYWICLVAPLALSRKLRQPDFQVMIYK